MSQDKTMKQSGQIQLKFVEAFLIFKNWVHQTAEFFKQKSGSAYLNFLKQVRSHLRKIRDKIFALFCRLKLISAHFLKFDSKLTASR